MITDFQLKRTASNCSQLFLLFATSTASWWIPETCSETQKLEEQTFNIDIKAICIFNHRIKHWLLLQIRSIRLPLANFGSQRLQRVSKQLVTALEKCRTWQNAFWRPLNAGSALFFSSDHGLITWYQRGNPSYGWWTFFFRSRQVQNNLGNFEKHSERHAWGSMSSKPPNQH